MEIVELHYQGQSLSSKKITIEPFAKDPKRDLFKQLAGKIYEFTFSEGIPGSLYQIRSRVPVSG